LLQTLLHLILDIYYSSSFKRCLTLSNICLYERLGSNPFSIFSTSSSDLLIDCFISILTSSITFISSSPFLLISFLCKSHIHITSFTICICIISLIYNYYNTLTYDIVVSQIVWIVSSTCGRF